MFIVGGEGVIIVDAQSSRAERGKAWLRSAG
jgi:hypothetical protein